MTSATIHEAKTNLSRLIQRALSGEKVVIYNRRRPVVTLEPVKKAKPSRRIGGVKNLVRYMADDFTSPMDDFSGYHP